MSELHHLDHRSVTKKDETYNFIIYIFNSSQDCLESIKLRNLQKIGSNLALRVGYNASWENQDSIPTDVTIPLLIFADDSNGKDITTALAQI